MVLRRCFSTRLFIGKVEENCLAWHIRLNFPQITSLWSPTSSKKKCGDCASSQLAHSVPRKMAPDPTPLATFPHWFSPPRYCCLRCGSTGPNCLGFRFLIKVWETLNLVYSLGRNSTVKSLYSIYKPASSYCPWAEVSQAFINEFLQQKGTESKREVKIKPSVLTVSGELHYQQASTETLCSTYYVWHTLSLPLGKVRWRSSSEGSPLRWRWHPRLHPRDLCHHHVGSL